MKGHYYTTDPKDASKHISNDSLVLEEVACYVYKFDPNQPLPPGAAKFYQLYDKVSDFRFYTADENEVVQLFGTGNFTEEAIVGLVYWPQQPSGIGTTQFYRLRQLTTNEHLYTTNQNERDTLVNSNKWEEEKLAGVGAGYYVFDPGQAPNGSIPLYRLFKQ